MSQANTPSIVKHLTESVVKASKIDAGLYEKFSVKRGLRNADHTGVLVGLTNVGDVVGYKKLPNKQELADFMEYMGSLRELPDDFTNSMILANKGYNIMNMLARSVLGLYNSDKNAEVYCRMVFTPFRGTNVQCRQNHSSCI